MQIMGFLELQRAAQLKPQLMDTILSLNHYKKEITQFHYKSSLICLDPGCAEPNFAQDIKYNIIAE